MVRILLIFRAQDKAAMQLSELEEEMDQRIQAAEHKTRKDVSVWGSFIHWVLMDHLLWTGHWESSRCSKCRLQMMVMGLGGR